MVDHILKISRPGVFDNRCLSWETAIIVFMYKRRMDRRRYKSRHMNSPVSWNTLAHRFRMLKQSHQFLIQIQL